MRKKVITKKRKRETPDGEQPLPFSFQELAENNLCRLHRLFIYSSLIRLPKLLPEYELPYVLFRTVCQLQELAAIDVIILILWLLPQDNGPDVMFPFQETVAE